MTPPNSTAGPSRTPVSAATLVRDLVLERPQAVGVFESFGIDYCCGGDQTLASACKVVRRSVEEVTAALDRCEPVLPQEDWRNKSLTELAQYIVEKHHAFTRAEINRFAQLLAKVVSAHGQDHPELVRVQTAFASLAEELREHMRKEEELLFPYIAQMEEAARMKKRAPEPMFGSVQNPVAVMIMEHEASGQALDRIREATSGYSVPSDGGANYRSLYEALPLFAADLHQHIHLENNILFPRAIELESAFAT